MVLRIVKTNHAIYQKYGYMHTEISIAMHSTIQMILYRDAIVHIAQLC